MDSVLRERCFREFVVRRHRAGILHNERLEQRQPSNMQCNGQLGQRGDCYGHYHDHQQLVGGGRNHSVFVPVIMPARRANL